jgi:hypothetical protein
LFSVPGGPAAAIFLGALFTFGYYPGPRMVTQNPDLMYLIVWSRGAGLGAGGGDLFRHHATGGAPHAHPLCHHRRTPDPDHDPGRAEGDRERWAISTCSSASGCWAG